MCGKDADVRSLQEILIYGLKGMCSYAHHARRLGMVDEEVDAFVEEALFATVTNVNFDIDSLFELVLECGRKNLRVTEMLDEGHMERFGAPSPTTVFEGTKAGPVLATTNCVLIPKDEYKERLFTTQTRATAVALAGAFECGVNDLPLTIVLSWFEQKAVAVLLTLFALDVKGVRIGPAPPAFVSPNVFKILQDKYDLKLTSNKDPLADLRSP